MISPVAFRVLAAALLLLGAASGDASTGTLNPSTGSIPPVHSLLIDPVAPTTVYAGTDVGVFKSTDSGDSWRLANAGLSNAQIASLEADPVTPDLLYAGTSAGLYRSADGAATWNILNALRGTDVFEVAIDPTDHSRIFAGTRSGLFRSLDDGQSWNRLAGQQFGSSHEVLIDPVNTRTVYVLAVPIGFTGSWVFKSANGGDSWQAVTSGLPFGLHGPVLGGSIAIDRSNPSTLYAAAIGVYKTINGAASWFPINRGFPCPFPPLCDVVTSLAIDPVRSSRIYAGTRLSGLFRSTDGGELWIPSNTGLEGRVVQSLEVDPSRPDRVFAGTDRGVFRSDDAGATWREVSQGLSDPAHLRLLSGRFLVELSAHDPRTGRSAAGQSSPVNDLFGYVSLPALTGNADNPEVFVKMLDGRAVNGQYWVFYGGLTDLEFTLTVTDTASLRTHTYHKEFGSPCGGFDTTAF